MEPPSFIHFLIRIWQEKFGVPLAMRDDRNLSCAVFGVHALPEGCCGRAIMHYRLRPWTAQGLTQTDQLCNKPRAQYRWKLNFQRCGLLRACIWCLFL